MIFEFDFGCHSFSTSPQVSADDAPFGLSIHDSAAERAVSEAEKSGQLKFPPNSSSSTSNATSTQGLGGNKAVDDGNSLLSAARLGEPLPLQSSSSTQSPRRRRRPNQDKSDDDVVDDESSVYDEDKDLVLKHIDDDLSRTMLAKSRRREAEDEQKELQKLFDQTRRNMQRDGDGGSKKKL